MTLRQAQGKPSGRQAQGEPSALPNWARFAAPLVVGAVMLALWVLVVDVLHAAPRALPGPFAIINEIGLRFGIITEDMAITATNALLGLTLGAVVAILLAALAAAFRPIDGMLAPLVAAIAVVPIVALTPS